ncbi:TonB-dependent receptor [Pseudocolwellia sp. HL-MZ7]|uniref:TonB-dependent receptor n=1 Tax=Pseudocolwellia sp. HL-MZ7 TaxID=3400627 RepID=UPI003CED6CFC
MMCIKNKAISTIRIISLLLFITSIFSMKNAYSTAIYSAKNIVAVDIPAQYTKDALLNLALNHNVQIIFSPNVVGELLSPEIKGSMSVDQAIKLIIDENPLKLIRLSNTSYIIQRKKRLLAKATFTAPKIKTVKKASHIKKLERINIVGSHIKGSELSKHVSTRILDKAFVFSTGAVNGEELLRQIPQIGEISFNNERAIGSMNDARGDVSSINLRGIGTGYTLTLLNGRRLVQHPGTQTENFVPVSTANINTLPIKSLDRVEVLLGGGTALYGSDAVAGVVNYIIDNNIPQNEFSVNYGGDQNTNFDQLNIAGQKSFAFNQDNSLANVSLNYYQRNGIMADELPNAESEDRRQADQIPDEFLFDSQLDNRSSYTPWAEFQHPTDGIVHIQPITLGNCTLTISESICSALGETPADLKFDRTAYRTMTSDVKRINFHGYFSHLLSNEVELFSDTYLYHAKTERTREQAPNLNIQRFTIAKTAAYNPFDEELILQRYRPVDTGLREISVVNNSSRVLLGAKGLWFNWDWESALLYSNAQTIDTAKNRINATAFQQAINEEDPSLAYNLFNGGSLEFPNSIDSTINSQQVIDKFLVNINRTSNTSLMQLDTKWSNPEVYALKNGYIEIATGIELRRETFSDDRDELLDGSTPFIDNVTGITLSQSNVLGSSYTLDSKGDRNIVSTYFDSYIPLFKNTSAQLAFRYENYSDIGNVAKAKVAITSKINQYLLLRSSWANGFRAPNLPQIAEEGVSRFNFIYDPTLNSTYGISEIRFGNEDLKPEDNVNLSFGSDISLSKNINLSIDWWKIKQRNVIGITPASTVLLYDGLFSGTKGKSSNITRDEFGNVVSITNQYTNLSSRKVSGIDYNATFKYESNLGLFSANLNIAQLLEFQQGADPISAEILKEVEKENPNIPSNTILPNIGNLLNNNGRPSLRINQTLDWRLNNIGAGLTYNYISKFNDRSVQSLTGGLLPISDYHTYSAYISYSAFNKMLNTKTKIVLGIKNITNQLPPIADESFGYFSSVHSNIGRYVYIDMSIKI